MLRLVQAHHESFSMRIYLVSSLEIPSRPCWKSHSTICVYKLFSKRCKGRDIQNTEKQKIKPKWKNKSALKKKISRLRQSRKTKLKIEPRFKKKKTNQIEIRIFRFSKNCRVWSQNVRSLVIQNFHTFKHGNNIKISTKYNFSLTPYPQPVISCTVPPITIKLYKYASGNCTVSRGLDQQSLVM